MPYGKYYAPNEEKLVFTIKKKKIYKICWNGKMKNSSDIAFRWQTENSAKEFTRETWKRCASAKNLRQMLWNRSVIFGCLSRNQRMSLFFVEKTMWGTKTTHLTDRILVRSTSINSSANGHSRKTHLILWCPKKKTKTH